MVAATVDHVYLKGAVPPLVVAVSVSSFRVAKSGVVKSAVTKTS